MRVSDTRITNLLRVSDTRNDTRTTFTNTGDHQ